MTKSEFDNIVADELTIILSLISKKGNEYSTGDDRFGNFYAMASLQDIKPEEALRGAWSKHIVSIMDFIYKSANGGRFTKKQWREKLHDNIVYSLLLFGLLEDLDLFLDGE